MPLYDYDCSACGRRFEAIHGVDADPPASCPLCGSGPVRKAFAAPAIHFKGSGWAKKERRSAARSKDASAKEGSESDTSAGSSGEGAAPVSNGSGDTTAPSTKPSTSSKSSPPPAGAD
jgi:putative FmdB family regulatory protein